MTAAGYTFGSAGYMSPEQSLGNPLDHRSDLYSLGVLFWEMLTGNKPYNADNTFALAYKHATEPIPELPEHLSGYQAILNKLLAKRPEDRFDTAEDFAVALETLQVELTPSGIQAQLDAADATQVRPSASSPKTATTQNSEPAQTEPRSNTMIIGLIAGLVLLVGAAAVYFAIGRDTAPAPSPEPVVTSNPTSTSSDTTVQSTEPVRVIPSPSQSAQTEESVTQTPVQPPPVALTEPPASAPPETITTTAPKPETITETPRVAVLSPGSNTTTPQPETTRQQESARRYLEKVQQFLDEDAWEEGLEQIEAGLNEIPANEDLLALRSEIKALIAAETQEARKQRQIHLAQSRLVKKYQEKAQQFMQEGKLQESLKEIQTGLIILPGYDSLLELRDEVEALMKSNRQ
jgi:serine/threonine-protein kinase PpkA